MDLRRLIAACNNKTTAGIAFQVRQHSARRASIRRALRERTSNFSNVARPCAEPMIRFRARNRGTTFENVKPIHDGFARFHLAAPAKLTSIGKLAGSPHQEVRIERNDDVRILEAVLNVRILSERQSSTSARVVAVNG